MKEKYEYRIIIYRNDNKVLERPISKELLKKIEETLEKNHEKPEPNIIVLQMGSWNLMVTSFEVIYSNDNKTLHIHTYSEYSKKVYVGLILNSAEG
jgi:hypothetical protein